MLVNEVAGGYSFSGVELVANTTVEMLEGSFDVHPGDHQKLSLVSLLNPFPSDGVSILRDGYGH